MFNAPHLKSLEEIRTIDVRSTKTVPVRIRATDFNNYIVKVQSHPTSKGVIKEWLCAHFLKIWDLPVPDFAVIDVQEHHIPVGFHPDYQPFYFDRPAFGSKVDRGAIDVSDILDSPKHYQKALSNSSGELMLIALFDIWTANIDRHEDNYNLIYSGDEIPRFRPIDHEMALDFLDFDDIPSLQTENESLIDSVLFKTYVSVQQRKKAIAAPNSFEQFLGRIAAVQSKLATIIGAMPQEWKSPIPSLEQKLKATIFTKN